MKIGYVVEGSTDEAFLIGLKARWCPDAELVPLGFRGSTLRHRDYPRILGEAQLKSLDVVIFLTDSNDRNWNTVLNEERQQLKEAEHYVLLGVAERNIECWLCSDIDYIATKYNYNRDEFRVDDPKQPFQRAVGIRRDDKRAEEIAAFVHNAPSLKIWISNSRSFRSFYNDARQLASTRGCQIPDELASVRAKRRRKS